MITTSAASRLLAALPDLHALGPLETFPAKALSLAHHLIACDDASFNQIDLQSGAYRVLVDPADRVDDPLAGAFAAYIHQHPVIAHVAATGDQRPRAVSELLRPAQLHRLELYTEFFAELGIDDQLSVTLTAIPGQRVVGLALNRGTSFEGDESEILSALGPHLTTAYRNAVLYSDALAGADEQSTLEATRLLARLTDRQHEVLGLIAQGRTNAQVAVELGCRAGTVKKHVEHILTRLGTDTRVAAARIYLDGSNHSERQPWWALDGAARHPLAG